MKKMALIVCVFISSRLDSFLQNFNPEDMGIDADIYFVHNLFKDSDIINRFERSDEEIQKIFNLLKNLNYNRIVLERKNVGEDLGAYHFAFNLLKNNYDYFFFLNEAAIINEKNWLKKVYDAYENNEKVFAVTPQLCRGWGNNFPSTVQREDGFNYDFALPTTYWSIRTSFGKQMKWPTPVCRVDAGDQEMTLVWPQVKKMGGYVAQVGNGHMLSYKNIPEFLEGIY